MVQLHYRDIQKIKKIISAVDPEKKKKNKKVTLPLSKRPLPNFYDKEKLIRLFENIKEVEILMGAFLGEIAGLRRAEVCNLKDMDVNLDERYLKVVQGKGMKDRIVKIVNPDWLPILRKWRRLRGESEHFIPSLENKKYGLHKELLSRRHKEALKRADLYRELKMRRNNGGIVPVYSFHTHRHTYATNLLRWGFELSMVQQQLGHCDVSITMRYNELTKAHIDERAEKIFGKEKKEDTTEIQNVTDPFQLLQMRLAKGEITVKKYNELVGALNVNQKQELGYIG